jgi:Tol biopolymer transport system component
VNHERWRQLDQLLDAALERPPAERAAFLDEACAGDELLRRQMEALLRSDESVQSFIEAPAVAMAAELLTEKQARPLVGQRVGHYLILSRLGAGGMGEVYRALDTRLEREVAIKVLHAFYSQDANRLRRFEQEARAISALNHPNILTIYDIGAHEDRPYIVTELLAGAELRAQLSNVAFPVRKALDYAQQIASGLAAAHEKGVVHRDLKPENLFITQNGRVKILDFGLAKLKRRKPADWGDYEALKRKSLTSPGMVMGTAGYMSPEQARGQAADHRSDIFSFGLILYEMLAGRRAFQGASFADLMTAIVKEEPPDLIEANSEAPPQVGRLVRRCLEKNPEGRFQTASDLGFAIESLAGAAGASQQGAIVAPAPAKRRSWPMIGPIIGPVLEPVLGPRLAGLGFALVVMGVVVGIFAGKAFWKTPAPTYQRLTFSRGTIWKARFAPDGQTVVYSARWNGQPLEVFAAREGKMESRPFKLENTDILAVSAANEMAILRNRQDLGMAFVSRGKLARISVDGGPARDLLEDVQDADWSPDGTKLAVARLVNGQSQLEYPVGNVLYKTVGYIGCPRISPKGDLVAFLDHQALWDNRGWVAVVNPAGKKEVLSGEWAAGVEGLAWSPAGDEVWFTAGKSGEADALYAVTLAGRERLVTRMPVRLMLHDISRDGHVLLSHVTDAASIIGHAPGETKERDLSWLDKGRLSSLSPDGKTILIDYWGEGAGINYAVYMGQTDGAPAVRLGDGASPRLSPDNKWALAVLNTPPQLALLPTGAGEVRRLERGPIERYSNATAWFPDGKQIVFQGRESGHDWRCYIQSTEGGPPRPITPEGITGSSGEIFISPDGGFVIAADAQHQRYFYPVNGGAPEPIPYLESEEAIIGWVGAGRSLYLARTQEMPLRVYRFDPTTGRKELLKEITPADPAGISAPNGIFMTPDGKGYVYSLRRLFSDLYLVKGLK